MPEAKEIGIEVNVESARAVFKKLGITFVGAQFTKGAGLALLEWVGRNFKAQGLEEPWQPLARGTIAARRKGGIGAQILQDTGRLRMSFVPGAPGNIFNADNSSVTVGTNRDFAKVHEEGGSGYYAITPKRGRVLAFNGGNGMVFARSVNHPPLPRRKMLPSGSKAQEILQTFATARAEQIVKSSEGA